MIRRPTRAKRTDTPVPYTTLFRSIEEALEGEARDAVGRDYYARGAAPGTGYRNGYRLGRVKSAEGAIDYSAPQIADREEAFRSRLRGMLGDRKSTSLNSSH